MSIFMVILTFIMLSMTFKKLATRFEVSSPEDFDKLSDKEIKMLINLVYTSCIIEMLFTIPFWIISALTINEIWIMAFATFNIIYLFHIMFRVVNGMKEKKIKASFLDKLVSLLNLIYILYFIIYFVSK